MRGAFLHKLLEIAAKDSDLMLLTGDLGYGLFEPFESEFPSQFMNVGIAEQSMAGVAAGLALEGHSVFCYSIANFASLRCLEQIRNDICYHNLNVTMVAQGGGFNYGPAGVSHHATEDLAIMRSLPNMTVLAPCCDLDVLQLMQENYRQGPSYLRLEKSGYDLGGNEVIDGQGDLRELVSGVDCAIVAAGSIASVGVAASERLREKGVSAKVLNLGKLKPLPEIQLLSAFLGMKAVVVIEEHNMIGGVFGALAELFATNRVGTRLGKLAISDRYTHEVGSQDYLREVNGLTVSGLVKEVLELLS